MDFNLRIVKKTHKHPDYRTTAKTNYNQKCQSWNGTKETPESLTGALSVNAVHRKVQTVNKWKCEE